MNTLACLMKETSGLTFEPYFAGGLVDEKGRYRWDPTPDFPFAITLLCFSKRQAERPLTWHEYLELFIPLDSHCRFQLSNLLLLSLHTLMQLQNQSYQFISCQLVKSAHTNLLDTSHIYSCLRPVKSQDIFVTLLPAPKCPQD